MNLALLKKTILIIAKIGVMIMVMAWLISQADMMQLTNILSAIDLFWLFVAAGMHLFAIIVGSIRWWLLFRNTEYCRYRQIVPSYAIGLFFNHVLPTGLGGDAVRIMHLTKQGFGAKGLVSSVLLDRGIGFIVIIIMGATMLLLASPFDLDAKDKMLLTGLLIAISMGGIIVFSPLIKTFLERIRPKVEHIGIARVLLDILSICYAYRKAKHLIFAASLMSLLMQTLVIFTYFLLGVSIGIELNLISYFAIVPMVFLATSVPISPGGLGVREGTMVALLTLVAVDTQQALSLSLLYLLVLWGTTLPGGLMLLKTSRPKELSEAILPAT